MDSPPNDRSAPRGILRYTTRPPKAQEFEMFGLPKHSDNACGVVIRVQETSSPSSPSPPARAYLPKIKTSGPSRSQSPATTSSVIDGTDHGRSMTPSSQLPPPPLRILATSTRSQTSSPTLVRSSSAASMEAQTPIMRSMFPRYNPQVSLAKQHYYPSHESNSRVANVRPDVGGSSSRTRSISSTEEIRSPNFSRPGVGISRRVPSLESDLIVASESPEPRPALSSAEELLDLWSVANGQGSQEAASTYRLRLSCSDLARNREVITFVSSSSQIFYMLDADENNLTISRSHPINPRTTIQVSAPTFSEPTANNPLMATIFPKMAELMALDQSSSIAVSHRLNRQTNADLQAEALARAYQHEATSLFWDTDSQKFYLIHPTLSGGSPYTFLIESNPGQITILSPDHTPTPTPILTLSLSTLTLTININLISHLPSLYILDTLLTTVLILLLHIHRSSPSPSTSPLSQASPTPSPSFSFPPPPPSLHSLIPAPEDSLPKKPRRWTFSSLLFKKPKSKPSDEETPFPPPSSTTITKTINAPPTPSQPTITPSTHHHHHPTSTSTFQTFDPKDENLPRTTRAVLRLLYWAFSVVVWALGMAVQILAAGVVGLGKIGAKL